MLVEKCYFCRIGLEFNTQQPSIMKRMLPADRAQRALSHCHSPYPVPSSPLMTVKDTGGEIYSQSLQRWSFSPYLCQCFSTLRSFTERCNILSEKIPDYVPLKILLCSLVDYNSRCQLFFFLNLKHRQFTQQCFGV